MTREELAQIIRDNIGDEYGFVLICAKVGETIDPDDARRMCEEQVIEVYSDMEASSAQNALAFLGSRGLYFPTT